MMENVRKMGRFVKKAVVSVVNGVGLKTTLGVVLFLMKLFSMLFVFTLATASVSFTHSTLGKEWSIAVSLLLIIKGGILYLVFLRGRDTVFGLLDGMVAFIVTFVGCIVAFYASLYAASKVASYTNNHIGWITFSLSLLLIISFMKQIHDDYKEEEEEE